MQVELVDIAPTILSLLNIDAPRGFRGNSLAELIDGCPPPYADRYAHAFHVVQVARPGAGENGTVFLEQLAVRSNDWKYIARPRLDEAELYGLRQDPHERTNVADRHRDVAGELHARIAPFWGPQRNTPEDPRECLAPALVQQLQALGYLGGAGDEDCKDDN